MKIQGDLATYELSDLLQWLAQGNKTGVLTVRDGDAEYALGFDHGRIDMSSSSDPDQRLDSYLHRRGVIDEATLARADRLRDATKMMSGQVLVTLGAVTEHQLGQALREKTEEILCDLLTWERGSFEFESGDRPASTMVPINLEVTKLLLESMHRLDQSRGGPLEPRPAEPAAAPEPAVALPVERSAGTDASATQAIEGLALAEVLDPESPPAPAPAAGALPADEHPTADLSASYAVMHAGPGPMRRLVPLAAAAVLGLAAVFFYLANREASAQAADLDPTGRAILFSQTRGPVAAPTRAGLAPVAAPESAVAPALGGDEPESEEALRQRYERELSDLRQELEEARRLAQTPARVPPGPPARTAVTDLPADSMMRAAVARSEPEPPADLNAARVTPPGPPAAAPSTPPAPPAAAATPPEVEPEVEPELPPTASEAAPGATAPGPLLRVVNPSLVSRPTPAYPMAALRHRRGATVVVRVLVSPEGRVEEVERVGPKAGLGFDRAAEEAAMASTWEPGTRDGEPTAMWAELRFEFKP